tara:strand:- start:1 stop:357 length:357 start_codon:yes stop_codon:yes gene_type:complete
MFGKNIPKPVPKPKGSFIGEDMRITGSISAAEPVVVLGQIDGNVDAILVHIRSTATVNGDINAQEVTIDGTVYGTISADLVHLSGSATLNGEVRSTGLEIDEGASIEAKFTKEQNLNG